MLDVDREGWRIRESPGSLLPSRSAVRLSVSGEHPTESQRPRGSAHHLYAGKVTSMFRRGTRRTDFLQADYPEIVLGENPGIRSDRLVRAP